VAFLYIRDQVQLTGSTNTVSANVALPVMGRLKFQLVIVECNSTCLQFTAVVSFLY